MSLSAQFSACQFSGVPISFGLFQFHIPTFDNRWKAIKRHGAISNAGTGDQLC
jgi:hypothetical protein